MSSPSAQLPLLQPSISPENGDFDSDTERGAAEDEAAEASEDEVDGTTVNYDIPSPPVDQHYSNLEVALQTIQEFAKEYGYALTTLRSKCKGGEVYKVYLQCNRGKFRSDHIVAEQNWQRMKGSRCLNCPFSATLLQHYCSQKELY